MNTPLYAEIIINNKHRETDRPYHYAVPDTLRDTLKPGCRVIVPFGMGNKQMEGYVMGLTDTIDFNPSRVKKILKLIDPEPVLPEKLLELARWMRDKYLCLYVDAIQSMVPTAIRTKSRYMIELNEEIDLEEGLKKIHSDTLLNIIDYLEANNGKAVLEDIKTDLRDAKVDYYIKRLQDMGIVKKTQSISNKMNKKMEKLLYINDKTSISLSKTAVKQKEVIDTIGANPGISMTRLKELCKGCEAVLRQLLSKNYIYIEEIDDYRTVHAKAYNEVRHRLTSEQDEAIAQIKGHFAVGRNVLLHGVTGSGKTEVYLEIIEEFLAEGKDSIVLVPEISLTPQMIGRFKGRFGDNVAVLHSNLSEGEKYDEWRKIKSGLVKVAVGARSAVFAPFANLGVIIIDEEHEHTYKSDIRPKYLTREVAEKRSRLENAHVILGSATPLIETYHKTTQGELGLVELLARVNGKPMPQVEVIDMREELKSGNKTIFSRRLTEEIQNTLTREDQLILFLNRRGHSTFVSCRQCGLVLKCPQCSISLTYHMKDDKVACHYCGFERPNPEICPKCKSKHIRYFGVGTQKVEKEFHTKFGITNTLRMDADTTARKNAHEKILDRFRSKESKVLLGTQMISKGLDFPDVTLVGVITADTSLNLPDFRAAERTFQMIAQVAGRSGRGAKPGEVIVQTYSPEHYSVLYAQKHDYKGFFDQEIRLRKELRNPPFASIANIVISGINEQEVVRVANEIGIFIDEQLGVLSLVEKLGPVAAALSKIKNRYRWQIVLKGDKEEELKAILSKLIQTDLMDVSDINVSIDLNPLNML